MGQRRARQSTGTRTWALAAFAVAITIFVAGCDNGDPGQIGASGVDGLSSDGQKQEYVDSVGRALQTMGAAQGDGFGKAIATGNKKALQASSIQWAQGVEQLKQVEPPKDVTDQHAALLKSVEGLDTWNKRIAAAAPNKKMTAKLGKAASQSPVSRVFGQAVCDIVDKGYDVVDSSACSPMSDPDAQAPGQ